MIYQIIAEKKKNTGKLVDINQTLANIHKGVHYSGHEQLGCLIQYYKSSAINQETVFQIKEQPTCYFLKYVHGVLFA